MLASNKIIMNATDVSVSVNSPGYWLDQVYGIAIQAEFSGSPVGVVVLQGSCDHGGSGMPGQPPNEASVVNWTTISGSSQAVTGAGPVVWNFNGVFYKWIRMSYSASSGTGTVTVTVNTKGE